MAYDVHDIKVKSLKPVKGGETSIKGLLNFKQQSAD
jgi:hypothetical protein